MLGDRADTVRKLMQCQPNLKFQPGPVLRSWKKVARKSDDQSLVEQAIPRRGNTLGRGKYIIARLVKKYGDRFTAKVLKFRNHPEISIESIAGRWALREAVFKATQVPISKIMVTGDSPPKVLIEGFSIASSISHDTDTAVAVAVSHRIH
jgi:phosphopantetheinyl transferase (holo-ACP synthase)